MPIKSVSKIFKEIVNEPEEQKKSDNDLILDHLDKLNKIFLSSNPKNADKRIVKVLKQL